MNCRLIRQSRHHNLGPLWYLCTRWLQPRLGIFWRKLSYQRLFQYYLQRGSWKPVTDTPRNLKRDHIGCHPYPKDWSRMDALWQSRSSKSQRWLKRRWQAWCSNARQWLLFPYWWHLRRILNNLWPWAFRFCPNVFSTSCSWHCLRAYHQAISHQRSCCLLQAQWMNPQQDAKL